MQSKLFFAAALLLALAACGGGGGGSTTPIPAPTNTPVNDGNIPAIVAVSGSSAFVSSSNQHTLYYLSSDDSAGHACTGGCISVWPAYMASAGSTALGNMSVITRADGTGQQWAYQGHPLYAFSGDSGALQANGDGIPQPPGTWHIARPAAGSGGGGGGGGGGY